MYLPKFDTSWPDSFKESYHYDLLELGLSKSEPWYRLPYNFRFTKTIETIKKFAAPQSTVLDIGAAQGNFSIALAELGYQVTWNDIREELSEYVKLKARNLSLRYSYCDLFSLNEVHYDVVLVTELIEHVAHPDKLFSKVLSLVKPGGIVVLSTPNGEYFLSRGHSFSNCVNPAQFETSQFKPNADGHIFLLTVSELKEFARQNNCEVIESQIFNNSLTCGHLKLRYGLSLLPEFLRKKSEVINNIFPGFLKRFLCSQLLLTFRRSLNSGD